MRLFTHNTAQQTRLSSSQYTIGHLRRAKFEDLAAMLNSRRTGYKLLLREIEDLEEPVNMALAERDFLDFSLDDVGQSAAAMLRGRSPNAAKERPYTDVLPGGIDAVISATLDETAREYTALVERASRFLPEGDSVRLQLETQIPPLVEQFKEARDAVAAANRARSLKRLEFEAAEDELDRAYEKVAGLLIARVGKRAANRFFPRARRKSSR